MTEPVKFCKDCKWYVPPEDAGGVDDLCNSPGVLLPAYFRVRGQGSIRTSCVEARLRSYDCGPDARFWEPRS